MIFMTIKGKNNFLFVRIKNAQPAFMNGIMMDKKTNLMKNKIISNEVYLVTLLMVKKLKFSSL